LFPRIIKRNILINTAPGVTVTNRFLPPPPAVASASATISAAKTALPPHAPGAGYLSQAIAQAEAALAAVTPPAPTLKKKVPTPKLKAKAVAAPAAAAPAPPLGDLRPFVAKQLLEFAQLKKDMCPITAEEYSAGNTAVMPCGHLFMQIAIEESFKKERGMCPACRQPGRPTYV
jgi:hypothetical protein